MLRRARLSQLDQTAQQDRTCIATGEAGTRETLIRFVLDPGGVVVADLAARLPGRGAWVGASRAAVETAAAKGLFSRAFKKPARLADGVTPALLAEAVASGLHERALSALGLARRVRKAVAGFDQVRSALGERTAAAVLTAEDAGADGAEKIARLAGSAPVIRAFSVAEQSAALGKPGVTHAALLAGAEAERFLRDVRRLAGFRTVFAAKAPAEIK